MKVASEHENGWRLLAGKIGAPADLAVKATTDASGHCWLPAGLAGALRERELKAGT